MSPPPSTNIYIHISLSFSRFFPLSLYCSLVEESHAIARVLMYTCACARAHTHIPTHSPSTHTNTLSLTHTHTHTHTHTGLLCKRTNWLQFILRIHCKCVSTHCLPYHFVRVIVRLCTFYLYSPGHHVYVIGPTHYRYVIDFHIIYSLTITFP